MQKINLYEAKTKLSSLVDRASKGESFIIAKDGTPLAELRPLRKKTDLEGFIGCMKGEIWVAPDFDETPQEIIDAFEGHGPLIEADNRLREQLEAEHRAKLAAAEEIGQPNSGLKA